MPPATPAFRSSSRAKLASSNPLDDKLLTLERCLAASSARAVHLQRRLHLTLDALDAVQRTHEIELDVTSRAQDDLKRLYSRQVKITKAVESERDQLRDAAASWISKNNLVEAYGGSRVTLLEPLDTHTEANPTPTPRPPSSSYLSTCHRQLENERRTHASALQNAQAAIPIQKARVALCEAELDACVIHPDHTSNRRSTLQPAQPRDDRAVLDDAIAVNDALQRDNDALLREVDRLRSASLKPSNFRPHRTSKAIKAAMSTSPPLDDVQHLRQLSIPAAGRENELENVTSRTANLVSPSKYAEELQTEHGRLREVISAVEDFYSQQSESPPDHSANSRCYEPPPHKFLRLALDACAARRKCLIAIVDTAAGSVQTVNKPGLEHESMELSSPLPIPFRSDNSQSEDPSANLQGDEEEPMDMASPLYEATILPSSSSELDDEEDMASSSRSPSPDGTVSPTITRSPSMTLIPHLEAVVGGINTQTRMDEWAKLKWS